MPIIQRVALKPEKGSNSPTITQQVIGRTVGSNTCAPNPCTQPFPFAIPFPLPRMPFLPSIDEKLLLGSIVINWMILWSRQKGRQYTEALGHSGSEAGDLSLSWSLTWFQTFPQATPQIVDFQPGQLLLSLASSS